MTLTADPPELRKVPNAFKFVTYRFKARFFAEKGHSLSVFRPFVPALSALF